MKEMNIARKILRFIFILCAAVIWFYVTIDLMFERWGGLAIGAIISFGIIALFAFISYYSKYYLRK